MNQEKMNYKIKISYKTGDSFNTYDAEDFLELEFKNLNNAKENLSRIKKHYEMYQNLNRYNSNKEEIYHSNENEDWYVKSKVDKYYYAKNCLNLITDSGNNMQMRAFWCGYFEILESAEIITDNSDLKIEF